MWWCVPVALALVFLFVGVPTIIDYKADQKKNEEDENGK